MCWIRLMWNAERMGKFIPQQRCCTSKRTVSDLKTRLNWRIVPNKGGDKGEGTTSKLGFGPGSIEELTSGTKHAAGLLVGCYVAQVGRLMRE